jgi:DNA-binding transcriptional MerR regulator
MTENTDKNDKPTSEIRDRVPDSAGDDQDNSSESKDKNEYTIDQLASVTGVPSRTIRFYQAKGVLPAPRREGRVAMYNDSHIERLGLVADLQNRGLRLRAVRDLLRREELNGPAVQEWLGIEQQIKEWSRDEPKLLSGQELKEMIGDQPAGVITRLIRLGIIEPHGKGVETRFMVNSPALLRVAMKLEQAGIALEISFHMYGLLHRRLAKAADEIVDYASDHVGKGFGKSDDSGDLRRAFDVLFSDHSGTEAVRLIFTREIDRAVGALLKKGRIPGARRRAAGR